MRLLMIQRRKELGLTQKDIADYIGKKRNTVAYYEKGTLNPPVDVAIKIKEKLQTTDDSIFLKQNVI